MGRKKSANKRPVGFKMPEEHYEIIERLADARGIDVSAILNQIVARAMPHLLAELADAEAAREKVSEHLLIAGMHDAKVLAGMWPKLLPAVASIIVQRITAAIQDGTYDQHDSSVGESHPDDTDPQDRIEWPGVTSVVKTCAAEAIEQQKSLGGPALDKTITRLMIRDYLAISLEFLATHKGAKP